VSGQCVSSEHGPSHAGLAIQNLGVTIAGDTILSQIDLAVPHGSTVALLGPSGCGKTTLLRSVAGLQAHTGRISWDHRAMDRLPAHRRDFGLVFQDHALFPHLSVRGNVGYGLRERHRSRRASIPDAERVTYLLDLVGLAQLADRPVDRLSGGEQQRVSLARALAPQPLLLMLDEPMSGLDRPLREQLLADIRRILAQFAQTALYVTHDLEEALAIADRVAVLNKGRIEQIAEPATLYARPETEFVARFLGLDNILPAVEVAGSDDLQTTLGTIPGVPGRRGKKALLHPARIAVRQGTDAIDQEAARRGTVQIPARVESTSFRGARQLLTLTTVQRESIRLRAYSDAPAPLRVGSEVFVIFRPADALVSLRE
jgi:ABC-type Fe3+/spermidine/putrescine transport system ATPase subunit